MSDLASLLAGIRSTWGLAPGAEITTEANPDSVDERSLAELATAGFTRVSFGMQSAVPHVLATLERTHDPERIPQVVAWARAAGLQVSLDLIYGTPGESAADWQASLDLAIAQRPDHLSAYALIVEPGTKLARQISRGEVPQPDDDLAPTCTSRPTPRSPPPGTTGTRSATGLGMRRPGHAITSPTGRGRTGGASAPERTATSAECAGGT